MTGMSKVAYLVHIEPAESGGFTITVPKLPGCQAKAATFEVALDESKKLIEGCLKRLVKAGEPIPMESQTMPALCFPMRVTVSKPKASDIHTRRNR
jgi:predicted RNase H-like HicB family nuclease